MSPELIKIIGTVGQILGIVVVGLAILSYQMPTKKSVMTVQICTTSVMSTHYLLIGAYPGMAMNIFGIVRNVIYYKTKSENKYLPIILSAVIGIIGFISWDGYHSLLAIAGLVINSYSLSKDPQFLRKSILVSSPLVLIYDIMVMSVGGILLESLSIVSAVIGIVRFRKDKTM